MEVSAADSLQLVGGARRDAKSLVVGVLVGEWPLTAKQVFYKIRKESPDSVTYQGVHKALKQLLVSGVVSKNNGAYSLSPGWIKGLKKFSEQLEYQHVESKKLSLSQAKPGSPFFIAARTFSLLTTLLFKKQLRLESDAIYLFGHRVNMVPTVFLAGLTKNCIDNDVPSIIYLEARKSGYNWSRRVVENGFVHTPEELTLHGADAFTIAGWPPYVIEEFDLEGKKLQLSLLNSPIASEYVKLFGKSKEPVCYILSGFYAGGFSVVFKEGSFEAIESSCIAKGDEKCVFVLRSRKDLDLRKSSVVRKIGRKAEVFDMSFIGKLGFKGKEEVDVIRV